MTKRACVPQDFAVCADEVGGCTISPARNRCSPALAHWPKCNAPCVSPQLLPTCMQYFVLHNAMLIALVVSALLWSVHADTAPSGARACSVSTLTQSAGHPDSQPCNSGHPLPNFLPRAFPRTL